MKRILFILASGLLLSGCYNTPKPAAVTPAQPQESAKPSTDRDDKVTSGTVAEISGFKFTPEILTVKAGQTVKFTNRDSVAHTVTADDGTSFESGLLGKDQSGTIVAPSKPGSYGFHCSPHPNMKGTLVVE